MPRKVEVYNEGETVMIKAKIARVHFEKERVSYELNDFNTGQRYLNRFSDKDIMTFKEEKDEGKDSKSAEADKPCGD